MQDDKAGRIAKLEADNSVRQAGLATEIIEYFLEPGRPFALRPSHIKQLQSVAVAGLVANPGHWRNSPVGITKSKHVPPGPHLVEPLVQEMCDYVNDNFHEKTALHLAAYIMWRLNWIHPFSDGNGRTSRAVSYIVLCSALRILLPGTPSIPQQIEENKSAYFRALETADEAWRLNSNIDVSVMEDTLKGMLARQLLSVIDKAVGGTLAS
jgi:Fic family protein